MALRGTQLCWRRARKMHLEEPALYGSDEAMARQLLESGHPSLSGVTLEALKARCSIRLNYPDPFVPFRTAFPTACGKLECVRDRMAEVGLVPRSPVTHTRGTR